MAIQTALIDLVTERPACVSEGCGKPAKYRCVWAGDKVEYCEVCATWAMQVAAAIAYTEPRSTLVRLVTPDEFDPGKSSNEYA